MDYHKCTFARSTSITQLQQQSSEQNHMFVCKCEHRDSYAELLYRNDAQNCSNTAVIEGIEYERSSMSSISNEMIAKPNDQGGSHSYSTQDRPDSETILTYSEDALTVLDGNGAQYLAFATQSQANMCNADNFNTGISDVKMHSRHSSGAGNAATFISREDSQDCKDQFWQTNRMFSSLRSPGVARSPQGLHVPGPSQHHKRESRRLSSISPSVPSPLGPGQFRDNWRSDVSGLVSPLPASPGPWNRVKKLEAQKSPLPFDMHGNKSSMENKRIPCQMDMSFGHYRKYTDPFVDHHLSPAPSPHAASPRDFCLSSPFGTRTPTSSTLQFHRDSVTRVNLPIPPPPLDAVQGRLRHTPKACTRLDAQKAVRENWIRTEAKRIAGLSRVVFAASQAYQQSRQQKDYDAWERAQAAFIDATNLEKRQEERRNLFLPAGIIAMRTGQMNVVSDGSVAYPVTPEFSSSCDGSLGDQKEGKLLGWRMALMERVCAETKIKDETKEAEESNISKGKCKPRFWFELSYPHTQTKVKSTLTTAEKDELRKKLVACVEQATNHRYEDA